jgi:hypothetical protein
MWVMSLALKRDLKPAEKEGTAQRKEVADY